MTHPYATPPQPDTPTRCGPRPVNQTLGELRYRLTHGPNGPTTPALIPTGFGDLDRLVVVAPGTYTLLFGQPGVGASTLALSFALGATTETAGVPALIVSWQTPRPDVEERLLAATARVHVQKFRDRSLGKDDWARIDAVTAKYPDRPLYVTDEPERPDELMETLEEWVECQGGRSCLVVLDGLPQLARSASNPDQAAWDEHARLSARIKAFAVRTGAAVVLTAPVVSDAIRNRATSWPVLGDVAYSPAYVTDADAVIGVYRHDLWVPESSRAGEADLVLLKHRLGPRDVITVAYQGHYARFVDMQM